VTLHAVHLLTGPSGTGKTQLAARTRKPSWPRAGAGRLVKPGPAGPCWLAWPPRADAMGLSAGGREQTRRPGPRVRCWLEADGDRCLLVFDGAEEPVAAEAALSRPRRGPGADQPPPAAPEPVPGPASGDSWRPRSGGVPGRRTGLADPEAPRRGRQAGAPALALAQAAAVIAALHLEYPAYLEGLRATAAGRNRPTKIRRGSAPLSARRRAGGLAGPEYCVDSDETGMRKRSSP